jgi:AcrR family transcriptional regulator
MAMEPEDAIPSRMARRRASARERLIESARTLIARKGIDETTIADITDAADVAIGSFYNHFRSKEELVESLVATAIETHGTALDSLAASVSDPAELLSICIRHTVRMADHDPVWAWFAVRAGLYVRELELGLGARLMRDLQRGIDSGCFTPRDVRSALVVIGGATVAAMQGRLIGVLDEPADHLIAEHVLRMLGVPAAEAERIANLPLGESAAAEAQPHAIRGVQ